MNDDNYILYMDGKGVRHLEKLDTAERINVIGFTRYSVLMRGSEGDGAPEHNGSYPIITSEVFNELFGKVLTVIDASFPKGEQKDAFKSIVKSTMSDWYDKNTIYQMRMTKQALPLIGSTDERKG